MIASQKKPNPQQIVNGQVHNWYKITLGFSDHLVDTLLSRFDIEHGQWILDPFCGSGTTLVECKKRGINSVGVDANPSSFFASRVKTNWELDGAYLTSVVDEIKKHYKKLLDGKSTFQQDITYSYLFKSGMIERGWISPKPLKKSIALKNAIKNLDIAQEYKDILFLALLDDVVIDASNIKFGPQPYCSTRKEDVDVIGAFVKRIKNMVDDLEIVGGLPKTQTIVHQGDARNLNNVLGNSTLFSGVICSPPYPGEHDYTRHARLELAFLEEVTDRITLQSIKKRMVRSNTKGIYKEDSDSVLVKGNNLLEPIVEEIQKRAISKTHGFARLYHNVVLEYFGGMKKHLESLYNFLEPNAQCAYILGDQSSFLQVYIPTAEILASIASELGYTIIDIVPWRTTWSTTTSKKIDENILIFSK